MAPKRKRATTRHRKPAKRQRHMTYGQVGGVSPGLIVGIGKAGYGITKALGNYQTKRAVKIAEKCPREVEQGKRKRYAGESFKCYCLRNCSRGQKLWSTDLAETWHRSWV